MRHAATALALAVSATAASSSSSSELEAQLNSVEADVRGGADPTVMQSEVDRISNGIRALSS